jgi:hypothetical protein
MKSNLQEVRKFQKIAGLLKENESNLLGQLQRYIDNTGLLDFKSQGEESEEAEIENSAIEKEITKIKGRDYFQILERFAELNSYRQEYAGPDEIGEVEEKLETLANELGYSVDQLNNI